MRLKMSRVTAEELLTSRLLEGYRCLDEVGRIKQSIPFPILVEEQCASWVISVSSTLEEIFPTELEMFRFRNPNAGTISPVVYAGNPQRSKLLRGLETRIGILQSILDDGLERYTDLPIGPRVYIQDIDSFRLVRDTNRSMVDRHLGKSGYLDWSEDRVQHAFEQILNVLFHKNDWGGEINDLYTANLEINGHRRATAFLLKGNGLKAQTMEIRDCGRNGDQLVRLFNSPAELFVVQFVGNVSENVIADVEDKVIANRTKGQNALYCIIDGQDTALLLYAYGKLN